jgi:hypothetical protein
LNQDRNPYANLPLLITYDLRSCHGVRFKPPGTTNHRRRNDQHYQYIDLRCVPLFSTREDRAPFSPQFFLLAQRGHMDWE